MYTQNSMGNFHKNWIFLCTRTMYVVLPKTVLPFVKLKNGWEELRFWKHFTQKEILCSSSGPHQKEKPWSKSQKGHKQKFESGI